MTPTDRDNAFEAYRPLLFSIAYRMLGSVAEAEDVVQETWLRAREDDQTAVQSPRAYLTTIVTRLCIDQLRSAARMRTEYPGPWLPEPIAEPNQEPAELASSLTMAFLLLLEQLTPIERAVFLLREVFEYDYPEIAVSVGKAEANCRQILARARARVRDPRPRFSASKRESVEIVGRFRDACASGDLSGLMALLDPDAQLVADGGGKAASATRPILGADRIGRFLMGFARKIPWARDDLVQVSINGTPGLLFRSSVAGDSAYAFDIADGRIHTVYVVRNPDKLRPFIERLEHGPSQA